MLKNLLIALALLGASVAQSQPIPNSDEWKKQTKAAENNKKSTAVALPPARNVQEAANPKSDDAENKHNKSGEPRRFSCEWWANWFYKFIDDPISLFTFVLAISTILLWLDTKGLRKLGIEGASGSKAAFVVATTAANAAKESAEAAKKTVETMEAIAQRELRAYVHIHQVSVEAWDVNVPTKIHVIFRNSGKTPAYDVFAWGTLHMMESPETYELPALPIKERPSIFNIAPEAKIEQINMSVRAPTAEEIQSLQEGKLVLYAYGETHYRDAFGVQRVTKYRYAVGGAYEFAVGDMIACEKGNEAT